MSRDGNHHRPGVRTRGSELDAPASSAVPGKRTLTEALVSPHVAPATPATVAPAVQMRSGEEDHLSPVSDVVTPAAPRPTLQRLFGGPQERGDANRRTAEAAAGATSEQVAPAASTDRRMPEAHETPAVQLRRSEGARDGAEVHAAAARGTATPASPLPHGEAIQGAFGKHDVSHIQAHTGTEATASARAMGAEAFATGDHVAFAGTPSLHTAAHEAAHVVQQRGGVQLKGGVGQAGDVYEQHADAVADAVVAGRSAAALLDQTAPTGGATPTVQRKENADDAKILENQASLKNTDAEIPALEGALLSTRMEAVKRGLLSKASFDASLALSQAMVQLQPAVAAKGTVDAGVQAQAAQAAQQLFAALRRDTSDEKNFHIVPSMTDTSAITSENPYTGESRVTTLFSTSDAVSWLEKLPTIIRQGQWEDAFRGYRRLVDGLDLWVADQLRKTGKGTNDEVLGNAQQQRAQLRTALDQVADRHATRIPALFHPDAEAVAKEKADGRPAAETVAMNVYFWKDEKDGTYHLYDLTTPGQPRDQTVSGPPTAAIMNTFFEEVARYPKGEVRYTLPGGVVVVAPTTGKIKWYEWLGYAGLAVAAAGLALATAGASVPATVCFAAGALAGGLSAGGHLADSVHLGTATTATVVLDVAQIAASFASLGAMSITVKAGSAASALAGSRYFVPLVGAAAAADSVQLVALTSVTFGELDKIQRGAGSAEDKQRAMAVLLTQLIVTGGLTALSVQGARNIRAMAKTPLELADQNGVKVLRVVGESTPEPVAALKPAEADSHSPSSSAGIKDADRGAHSHTPTDSHGPRSGGRVEGESQRSAMDIAVLEKLSKELKPYEVEALVKRVGAEQARHIANTMEGPALRDRYTEIVFGRLREEAAEIRTALFPGKAVGKKNIAVAEAHLEDGTQLSTSSTSGPQGKAPKPKPASQGGQFEPTADSVSGRIMDTDPEYKSLSQLGEWIEKRFPGGTHPKGKVYLYTEMEMCDSCAGIKAQFEAKFPGIEVIVVADHPYPFPK